MTVGTAALASEQVSNECKQDGALTDAMWARTEHMLPGKATDPRATAPDKQRFLETVLWRIHTASARC